MGWMIAGAVLVVGGIIAAVSMGEERENQRRKQANRFPMPQPMPDWQARINMPQPASLQQSSLLQ